MIFLGSLITVFISYYRDQNKEIAKSLNDLMQQSISIEGESINDLPDNIFVGEVTNATNIVDSNKFFSFKVKDRKISKLSDNQSDCKKVANKINNRNNKNGKIKFNGQVWQYQTSDAPKFTQKEQDGESSFDLSSDPTSSIVACLNITNPYQQIIKTGNTFIIVGIISLIGIFALSFYFTNLFLKPVQKTWESQQQFVSDASHELKTPIAIINSNVDVLMSEPQNTISSQQKWINNIYQGTRRMENLINQMLQLSRIENDEHRVCKSKINVSNLFINIIDEMGAITHQKKLKILKDVPSNIEIITNEDLLQQILQILCENAVEYTPVDGEIRIKLQTFKDQIIFEVKNSGTPLLEEEIPQLFERFYRSDKARNSKNNNFGMGLAIAKAQANELKGKLSAANGKDGFITFSLALGT